MIAEKGPCPSSGLSLESPNLDETHHSIHATSFGLISCDITGVIIERDFWNCIKAGPSLRILRCPEGTVYTRTISF